MINDPSLIERNSLARRRCENPQSRGDSFNGCASGREIGIVCAFTVLCCRKNKRGREHADWNLSFHFSWRNSRDSPRPRCIGRHVATAPNVTGSLSQQRLAVFQRETARENTRARAKNRPKSIRGSINCHDELISGFSITFAIAVARLGARVAKGTSVRYRNALLSVVKCLLLSRLGYPELE